MSAAAARADLGPIMPSRAAVHAQALELKQLAQRAVEFSGCSGQSGDLQLALRQFERMRAILGGGDG